MLIWTESFSQRMVHLDIDLYTSRLTEIYLSLFRLFSSAVFGENPRYYYSLGVVVVVVTGVIVPHAETLAFCDTSLITEDIYLKFGVCVHYPKSNPYYQEKQFKIHFF